MNPEIPTPEIDSEIENYQESPEAAEADEKQNVIEELNQVHQLAKSMYETVKSKGDLLDFKQITVQESANALRTINYMDVPEDTLKENVRNYFILIEPYFEDEIFEDTKRGILSEACIGLSLEELGFHLHETFADDDSYGGIDILADTKDPNDPILAIQVKGHRRLDETVVESLAEDKVDPKIQEAYANLTREQILEKDAVARKIVYWINSEEFKKLHPELKDREILPLIISIPTKDEKDAIIAPFTDTGAPIKGFPDKLYDKLEPIIWEE